MTITIAQLAQFCKTGADLNYLDRAEALVEEYRFEKARLEESDCHDQWARIVFGDGSSLFVSQRRGLFPSEALA